MFTNKEAGFMIYVIGKNKQLTGDDEKVCWYLFGIFWHL